MTSNDAESSIEHVDEDVVLYETALRLLRAAITREGGMGPRILDLAAHRAGTFEPSTELVVAVVEVADAIAHVLAQILEETSEQAGRPATSYVDDVLANMDQWRELRSIHRTLEAIADDVNDDPSR